MNTLHAASEQWATRPDDQRYTSLADLKGAVVQREGQSWTREVPLRSMQVRVYEEERLRFEYPDVLAGETRSLVPSHWSFGQLASHAKAPAGYLRTLPATITGINLQFGLERLRQENESALVLGHSNGQESLRALTGPKYGRIWDRQVVEAVERVNTDNRWKVPSASYATLNPRRATTLYASDRDVFIFMVADGEAIEVGDDKLFRGFYTWNSEVGSATFGLTTFLYRYVCDNRIIWGVEGVDEVRIRHTRGAPERFAQEGHEYLDGYLGSSGKETVRRIRAAQAFELARDERQDGGWSDWLRKRGFSPSEAAAGVKSAEEEGGDRSLWDIINGVTASARSIAHTDSRVALEAKAGSLMRFVP